MSTDRDWEEWGRDNPYYGVLSRDEFRGTKFDESARRSFMASGEVHVAKLLAAVRAHLDSGFEPRSALDFGCGVGRVVIPLARRGIATTGLDISPSMLAEAEANCSREGVAGARLLLSDDELSLAPGPFDLVHSFIVIQHIHPSRGHKLLNCLADRVSPCGVIAVQVPFMARSHWLVRILTWARYNVPLVNISRNLLRRRPAFEPPMQLHAYRLDKLIGSLRNSGFGTVLVLADSAAGADFDSAFLLARKDGTGSCVS